MKSTMLTAVLFACIACSENVPVTNGPAATGTGAAEAELEAQLVPQCKRICGWMTTCPGLGSSSCTCESAVPAAGGDASTTASSGCDCPTTTMTMNECLGTCLGDLGTMFMNQGEACAELGVDLLECYTQLDCSTVSTSAQDPCGTSAALKAACPNRNSDVSSGGDAVDTSGGNPSSFGGTTSTGVICTTGDATGAAPSTAGWQPNQLICEQALSNCSDGHSYRVTCGTTQDLAFVCQCLFDGRAQASFPDDPYLSSSASDSVCLSLEAMSSKCGWSLLDAQQAAMK